MEHYHYHPLSWLYAQVVLLVNNHLEWLQSKWSVRKIQCLSNMQNYYTFSSMEESIKWNEIQCAKPVLLKNRLFRHMEGDVTRYLRVKAKPNLWMLSNLSPFHSSHTTSILITFSLTPPPTLSLFPSFLNTFFSAAYKATLVTKI